MLYILVFDLFGSIVQRIPIEDTLACKIVAKIMLNRCNESNKKSSSLQSVTIHNEAGKDVWQEVMG